MNEIHLTINNYVDTPVSQTSWPIWKEEPERVAVRFKGKEYVIVLDEKQPFFEVWSVDENNELDELKSTFPILLEEND